MDILPIQGSAVPCERVFSSGKETTTARRNRIGPELMEALQMLKFAVRKGKTLNFTAGMGRSVELSELEQKSSWFQKILWLLSRVSTQEKSLSSQVQCISIYVIEPRLSLNRAEPPRSHPF
jgi:hAT family C-terminal dimerisation region